MSRKTLTLPPKSDAEKAAARSSPRKPIRGGAKPSRAAKPVAAASPAGPAGAKPVGKRPEKRPFGGQTPPAGAGATARAPRAPRTPSGREGFGAPSPDRSDTRAAPSRPEPTARRAPRDPRAPAKDLPYWPGVSKGPAPSAPAPAVGAAPSIEKAAPAPHRQPAPAAPVVPTTDSPRPPRGDRSEPPRLSKRMGELGLCSRREADEWIENGWVRVDGVVVDTLGSRVAPHARIEVDPAARQHQSECVTILIHKPVGYVSGQAEDGHEPASALIRPENRWADDATPTRFRLGHLRGLAPAGRLDIDSTGLLVFTQDGRIAKRLVGENSAVEKEYLVRVEGALSEDGMKLLNHGLELDGVKLKPAHVSWQNEDQLRFVLREGKKRQIRRMCELVGLAVTGLKRVRIGSVVLGKLPVGAWRYLRFDEKF